MIITMLFTMTFAVEVSEFGVEASTPPTPVDKSLYMYNYIVDSL